jgi:hypothetical protein
MEHFKPSDFATDLDAATSELDKLRELATACEQKQNAFNILKVYLEACDTFSRMHKGFTTDEAWLSTRPQTPNVQMILGMMQSTRESMMRSIAAVECRLIAAGVLGYPGQA